MSRSISPKNNNGTLQPGQNSTILLKEHLEEQDRWDDNIDLKHVKKLLQSKADLYNPTIQALIFDRADRITSDELKLYISFDKRRGLIKELLIRYGAAFPYRGFEYSHIKLLLSKFSPNTTDENGYTIFMHVLMEAKGNIEYMTRTHLETWVSHKTNFRVDTPIDYLLLYMNMASTWRSSSVDENEVSKITKFFVEKGIDPTATLKEFYKKNWEKILPAQVNTLDDLYKKQQYIFLKNALQGIHDGLIERGYKSARELEKLDRLPSPLAHAIAARASVGLLLSPNQKCTAAKDLRDRLAKSKIATSNQVASKGGKG